MKTWAASFCGVLALAVTAACSNNLNAASQAAAQEKSTGGPQEPSQPDSVEAWRDRVVRNPSPEAGCFQASYPSGVWEPVDCGPPPTRVYGGPVQRDSDR
jgi:hypothetical protein